MSDLTNEYQDRCAQDSDMQPYMPILFATVLRYPNARVTELGTQGGNSTTALLAAAELVEGFVWSVDINEVTAPAWFKDTGLWEFTHAGDMDPAVTPRPCDVLFIDTSHEYEHTLRELRKFVPSVKPGGTVLLHDTLQYWGPDAVWKALNDYCAESGIRWREIGFGKQGLGEIQIPEA